MWLTLALLTAVFTSCQDVLTKKILLKDRGDLYGITWGWWFFSLPFLWILVPFHKIPLIQPQFWKALAITSVLLVVAVIFYVNALSHGDLSLSVPMLAFTPVFMLVTSPYILKEYANLLGVIGIFITVMGSYLLNFHDYRRGILKPFKDLWLRKGPRYMLIVAIIFSVSGNYDKIGILSSSFLIWLVFLHSVVTVILTGILLFQGRSIPDLIRKKWRAFSCIGLFNALTGVSQAIAVQMSFVSYLIAVKRASVIFTALYGFLFLKEKNMRERLAGIILMVLGVLLIVVGKK